MGAVVDAGYRGFAQFLAVAQFSVAVVAQRLHLTTEGHVEVPEDCDQIDLLNIDSYF